MSFHYLRPAVDFNIFCPNSLFMLCLEKGRKKGVGKQHYIIISWRSNVIHVSWFYLFTYLPPSHMTHGGQSCSTVVICIKSCLLKIVPHPFFCSLFALFTSPSVFTSAFGHGSNFDSLEGVGWWGEMSLTAFLLCDWNRKCVQGWWCLMQKHCMQCPRVQIIGLYLGCFFGVCPGGGVITLDSGRHCRHGPAWQSKWFTFYFNCSRVSMIKRNRWLCRVSCVAPTCFVHDGQWQTSFIVFLITGLRSERDCRQAGHGLCFIVSSVFL